MTFEKTKDKIEVAVKDKDLYLMRSDLLRNVFLYTIQNNFVMIKHLFRNYRVPSYLKPWNYNTNKNNM